MKVNNVIQKYVNVKWYFFLLVISPFCYGDNISFFDIDRDLISTASRFNQTLEDNPSSVTILHGYIIRNLQINSVLDALRLVPGMSVGMASGNEFRVSYHGGNGLIPRRMLVLIDGVPIYRAGYARVDWKTIGVSVDEIDKIEVVRSPNSVSYGANAFQAVVNIKTKPLIADPVNKVKVFSSSFGDRLVQYRYADSLSEKNRLGFMLSRHSDSGFDKNYIGEERRDSSDIDTFNIKYESDLDKNVSIGGNINIVKGVLLNEFGDSNQITYPDIDVSDIFSLFSIRKTNAIDDEFLLLLGYTKNSWDQSWSTCFPSALFLPELRDLFLQNTDLANSVVSGSPGIPASQNESELLSSAVKAISSLGNNALSPTCGTVNQDFTDENIHLELQRNKRWGDLKTAIGIALNDKQFESETYVNGKILSTDGYLFANGEYKEKKYTINAGLITEKVASNKSFETSSRISLNYHLSDINTIRFIYSSSYRSPDLLETKRDWNYILRGPVGPLDEKDSLLFYYNSYSRNELKSEKNISHEISYLIKLPRNNIRIDIKLFEEKLTDLISEKLQFFDYNPTNDGFLKNTGAEIELIQDRNWLAYGLSYAYLDSDTQEVYERSLYSRHSGSFYFLANLNKGTVSFTYYGSSGPAQFSYDRYDIGYKKSINFENDMIFTFGSVASYIANDSGFIVNESFSVKNIYENRFQFSFGASLEM